MNQKKAFTDSILKVHPDPDSLSVRIVDQAYDELAKLFHDYAHEKVSEATHLAFKDGELWERYQNREIDDAKSIEDSVKEILEKLGL